MRIVLFGPPGVGKGTQARLLGQRLGLAHVATGNIIRAAIAANTPVGQEVRRYVDEGKLVPDPIVRRMAEEALLAAGLDDFILDGYPRTVQQAVWLAAFLEERDAPLDAVISMKVPVDTIVDRLSKRRVHVLTGENYHLEFKPPPADVPPEHILQRPDDRPEAIRKRLEVYLEDTRPVETFYENRGNFFTVDGVGAIDEVYGRITAVLRQATSHQQTT